jgi:hypothetical protein
MTDALLLLLVSLCSAVGGGIAGALVGLKSQRGEQERFDDRNADLKQQIEDLDERMLRFLRKQNKRRRDDALGATESDDHEAGKGVGLSLREQMNAIQRRARGAH